MKLFGPSRPEKVLLRHSPLSPTLDNNKTCEKLFCNLWNVDFSRSAHKSSENNTFRTRLTTSTISFKFWALAQQQNVRKTALQLVERRLSRSANKSKQKFAHTEHDLLGDPSLHLLPPFRQTDLHHLHDLFPTLRNGTDPQCGPKCVPVTSLWPRPQSAPGSGAHVV